MNPKLSIIMPCWKRPERTRRAISSVIGQTSTDWELLCVGDRCDDLDKLANDEAYHHPQIFYHDMPTHEGRFGTQCLNWGLDNARGQYVCFIGNDDYLLPHHVDCRIRGMEYFRTDLTLHASKIRGDPADRLRGGAIQHGVVGGSEITIMLPLARGMKFTSGEYGHDWTFLTSILRLGAFVGCDWNERHATYRVCSLPTDQEQGID